MATVTHLATNGGDTANVTSYVSASFTPTVGDLLVVWVVTSATVATGTMTASANGITLTKVTSIAWAGAANTNYLFIANQKVPSSPVAMTVTFDCTGDAATGAFVSIEAVAGMTAVGTAAVVQSATANAASGTTPAATFAGSALTGNPTLGCVGNANNPAAITPPGSWTELLDSGYSTPGTGIEVISRDSGFTGTTITWGGTTTAAHGDIIVELDASAPAADPTYVRRRGANYRR